MEIHIATSKFLMTNCACAHPWQSTRREIVLRGRSQTTLAQWCPFLTTYLLTYSGPGILMENLHTIDISRSTTYLPRLVSVVCERPPKLVPSAHWLFNYLYVFVCTLLVIVVVLANGGWKIPSNRWRRVSFRIEQNYIENVSAWSSKYSFYVSHSVPLQLRVFVYPMDRQFWMILRKTPWKPGGLSKGSLPRKSLMVNSVSQVKGKEKPASEIKTTPKSMAQHLSSSKDPSFS